MSDFFHKETVGPVFSPVINIKKENISPTVISAIDSLLSPSGNMFTRAETVKNLMRLEKLTVEEAARVLSLKPVDVANKLRLLEFSEKERMAVIDHSFCETDALEFLKLDRVSRLYAIEYCSKSSFTSEEIKGYVDGLVNSGDMLKKQVEGRIEGVRKFVVGDIGFFFNSIDNALRLARKAGFEVQNDRVENEDGYDIHINVKKQKTDCD